MWYRDLFLPNERLLHTSGHSADPLSAEGNPRIGPQLAVRNNSRQYSVLRRAWLRGVGRIGNDRPMERESIDVGWFILRPFTPDDIGWVYEVSRDPALEGSSSTCPRRI
jgi:hypothetical protein